MVQLEVPKRKKAITKSINFNSYMVQLEVSNLQQGHQKEPYFNSYMVQLEDDTKIRVNINYAFQFLYGTIRGIQNSSFNYRTNYFNSYMVQLEEIFLNQTLYNILDFNSYMVQLEGIS